MPLDRGFSSRQLLAVAFVSAALLIAELALTRIFSVIMYYHFAFFAISIALFGLSASGVFVYVCRRWLDARATDALLAWAALAYAAAAIVTLFVLVRLRVGLNYSATNLMVMLTIYAVAALPFFMGGLVIALAISRFADRIGMVYAADLAGAALGCLALIPLLDALGAPGAVLVTAALSIAAALLFAPASARTSVASCGAVILLIPLTGAALGRAPFDVVDAKGHTGDRILFSKWNSFSRIGVWDRVFGDWALSHVYAGPRPDTKYMDIDSAASTPILNLSADRSNARYLAYELTAIAYHLTSPGFSALVIGPGGGRDLASALVFGARHIDAVEINPLIANDVMRGRFLDFSGGIYTDPHVTVTIDDGRSFVRRSRSRYDVIQASLVDTWAATAAGAYTLTENTLYTVEAFGDYLDHLNDGGVLTITRWVADGLRLVSLAQAACEARGWDARERIAIVRQDRVVTFLLKRTPFTSAEVAALRSAADRLQFDVLYAPSTIGESEFELGAVDESVDGTRTGDYARLVTTSDRTRFLDEYHQDIAPTTDDRPFFFHTTKLKDQFDVAFGRSMLFGNGLSALLTLMLLSVALVALLVVGPLMLADRGSRRPAAWWAWLAYFGALGAGFMLIEVSVLQRFVLLLGHPVYSLTVTLFSLLLGTAVGSAWSRGFGDSALRRSAITVLIVVAIVGLLATAIVTPIVTWAMPFSRTGRILVAVAIVAPIGVLLGVPMPTGVRLLRRRAPEMVAWAWGMNGALSVVGSTLAIFIAMNWGFRVTLMGASAVYLAGLGALVVATRPIEPLQNGI